ncbi:hypothetical protein GCM10010174_85470 [Kutzneria viridogrisea]|uniref:Deoxyribonuclease NucA/NucB domain-containing protein n=2 Tax=Kutzneria TaxID=43356 RepID=W5WDY7_9PSEU|nr:NucA/NucB deoxyribonuclease domain-containing protein [Kutzneria albida]AHH98776.1 hypothetical protein KALB_5414 [Kutzneria albida DSM 43870]MBA8923711.1 hypothetical protein [Kutzneria viridogrisea]
MDTITVTSPNDAGDGPDLLAYFTGKIGFVAEYRDGKTIPENEDVTAINRVRFDSVGQRLGGKCEGTVFTDLTPNLEIHLTGHGTDQEARNVDDALHHPERTFPSVIGKSVPGASLSNPLHRLMDVGERNRNHDASVGICKDVWGPDYAAGGLDCDEYPYKTTREGSYTSTNGNPQAWNGSARPINKEDNSEAGTQLGVFYGTNRVLDNEAFTVSVVP